MFCVEEGQIELGRIEVNENDKNTLYKISKEL